MAKKKKLKQVQKQTKQTNSGSALEFIKVFINKHPNFLPLMMFCILLLIFFNEVMLGGKTYLPPDKLASKSVGPFIQDALSRGVYPLWNPYIFSGMPSFASLGGAPFVDILGNIIRAIIWPFKQIFPLSEFMGYFLNYFLLGIFTYVLLIKRTGMRMVALFAVLALVFQPHVISFAAFGHGTKLTTAVMIPILFLLLDELLDRRQLLYFALLALAVGLQLLRAHTQIAYYTFMMMGFYVIYWSIDSKINKVSNLKIFKSTSAVVAALVIGVAMSSWLYLSVLEYAHYSIRGGAAGLDYSYATNWSFSPAEIITFFIPSFMGFGGETYWGPMPFTSYPLYMGVVPLLFAGIALLIQRDKYVIFFSIVALLALVISFGKHFPVLYSPLFEFLPYFNKFRVPTMIHIILEFAVVVMAGIGLQALLKITDKSGFQKIRNYICIFGGICGFLLLFLIFGKSLYLDWVAGSGKGLAATTQEFVYKNASFDGLKLVLIIAATGFFIIYYLQGKIKKNTLAGAVIILLVVDLWLVDFKIVNPQPKANQDRYFAETGAVQFLKNHNNVEPFRIYPVYDDKPDNWYMYHKIQNIRGYSAAKIKIYQTFLESTTLDARNRYGIPAFLAKYLNVVQKDGQPSLQAVPIDQIATETLRSDNAIMDMLNVKYLVSYYPVPDPRYKPVMNGQPSVFENTGVLPRAYFVDEINVINNKDQFFNYLNSGQFNPAKEAILEEEPAYNIVPEQNNRVEITAYDIHEISLKAEVLQPALLVLSEIYYPAGWKAFVDGQETKIYKTNYILRSILLEPGTHDINFVFKSNSFKLGLWITFSILFILLAILVYCWRFKRNAN